MSKTYECEVRCLVFARVYVVAETKQEAESKLKRGGGYWDSADFEKYTAEVDAVESIKPVV